MGYDDAGGCVPRYDEDGPQAEVQEGALAKTGWRARGLRSTGNSFKGRLRLGPSRWRGPATVVLRECGNYYLSWHGKVLLVAQEQIRVASQ